jgi:hypothetical protein
MTKFVNARRQLSVDLEGFGEYQTRHVNYEYKCSCGTWFVGIGDVSEQVGDDPDIHSWLCPKCVAEAVDN